MLNFSPLGQYLVSLFVKHYYKIESSKTVTIIIHIWMGHTVSPQPLGLIMWLKVFLVAKKEYFPQSYQCQVPFLCSQASPLLPTTTKPFANCNSFWVHCNYKQNGALRSITPIILIRCPRHGLLIQSDWTKDQSMHLIIIPLQRPYKRLTKAFRQLIGDRTSLTEKCQALSYRWQNIGPAWS